MTKSKKSIVMHGMLLCPLAAASPLPTVLAACA